MTSEHRKTRLIEYLNKWAFTTCKKLSDITCTCLALDLANTARAEHFTESYCRVFNTFLPHFDMHIPFFSHDKDQILKFRTLAYFGNLIYKITNS